MIDPMKKTEKNDNLFFAYSGCRTTRERNATGKGINVFLFNTENGCLDKIQEVPAVNPSYLILDQRQKFLYSVHGDMTSVSAFAIDPDSGSLTFINTQDTGGSNPVHLTFDASGRFLIVANYATGSLAVFPVASDGSLEALVELTTLTGTPGPHKKEQTHSHPHQVQMDPSQTWIITPDKGLDAIFIHRLDRSRATLVASEHSPVRTRAGAGPRHIAFHPSMPFGYVANELDSTVTTYRFDASSGALVPLQILTTLPEDFFGDSTTAAIFTSSDGRHLYVSNRGHDSLCIFAVNQKTGLLVHKGWQSSYGDYVRFFTLDPTNRWLLAANERSHSIVPFRINGNTGGLQRQGTMVSTGSPVCLVFKTPERFRT